MAKLPHDDIIPYLHSDLGKKEQVAGMFNDIAPKYDFLNRFLSLGIDVIWRKKAIRQLKIENPKIILDVATGTGDMAILASSILKPNKIYGIDISKEMLELGKKKVQESGLSPLIELVQGDSETINFADHSFDAIMVAFGVRNFENLEKGLTEMLRVLKPGSRLIILEFSNPKNYIIRKLYNLYMGTVAPRVARWFCKNKEAYCYLNKSAKAFPERQKLIEIMNQMGYSDTSFKPLSLGICCIYQGRKQGSGQ
ncbi:MAG: bifunctional demethylmenaquinone methyltransferase/2-methoxy-6-polyprenyl-1,4-benzoquinol methylase UbiE [Chitinophagaceae bacterium]|jgi:demethylmenaquinone methyltransferase/2-methoxy-6-polyprenyl-1,4-benzoquinol methylase|nr:bifunctional demethylmenaquinone methyltransferase/2-methoxy-6-polyprenyl-1,4-benzoquinol methylase UbiE [Chitinophagaceae bacterium]